LRFSLAAASSAVPSGCSSDTSGPSTWPGQGAGSRVTGPPPGPRAQRPTAARLGSVAPPPQGAARHVSRRRPRQASRGRCQHGWRGLRPEWWAPYAAARPGSHACAASALAGPVPKRPPVMPPSPSSPAPPKRREWGWQQSRRSGGGGDGSRAGGEQWGGGSVGTDGVSRLVGLDALPAVDCPPQSPQTTQAPEPPAHKTNPRGVSSASRFQRPCQRQGVAAMQCGERWRSQQPATDPLLAVFFHSGMKELK
jgi:hypothetical protein